MENRAADADQRDGAEQHRVAVLKASRTRPSSVNAIAKGSAHGHGPTVGDMPISGCSSEAVIWNTRVMMPVWKKVSEYSLRNTG